MALIFRTHARKGYAAGDSHSYTKSYGSDWSDLREYHTSDSSRDIFWKKFSSSNQPYTKTRQEHGRFSIIAVFQEDQEGDFFNPGESMSRSVYRTQCQTLIEQNTRHQHIPYTGYTHMSISSIFTQLLKKKTKNQLIIFVITEIDDSFFSLGKRLAEQNDLIVLRILHPFELMPDNGVPLLGKIFDTRKLKLYQESFKQERHQLKKNLHTLNIDYTELITDQDAEMHMNFYFKHRYDSATLSHHSA